MKIFSIFVFSTILFKSAIASTDGDICDSVYGKHKLFHRIENHIGPEKFSEPKLVEVEIEGNGTLIVHYHFDDTYSETAVFSQNYPQLRYFNRSGGWELGCKNREPDCKELRNDVRSYILNSLKFLDIESEIDQVAKPNVAIHRNKVLACASFLREQIIASAK